VLPPIAQRQVDDARAVSANARLVAYECGAGQEAVQARLLQLVQTIDRLIALVESATFVAAMNHETIVNIAQAYRESAR
jgi:hypothetical protein